MVQSQQALRPHVGTGPALGLDPIFQIHGSQAAMSQLTHNVTQPRIFTRNTPELQSILCELLLTHSRNFRMPNSIW